jgi:hypothetical protein
LLIAHGDNAESDAVAVIAEALAWLGEAPTTAGARA